MPVLLLLGGCQSASCKSDAALALNVYVRDARTGELVGAGATVVARGPTRTEMAEGGPGASVSSPIPLGTEIGLYDISVAKPGYATWQRHGVLVGSQGIFCPQPDAQDVAAELQPLDGG